MTGKKTLMAGAGLAVVAVVLLAAPRRAPAPANWSAEDLRAELSARGLRYEGAHVGRAAPGEAWANAGYYLRRPEDPRSWGELAANTAHDPRSMRGYLLVVPCSGHTEPQGPEAGRVQVGRLVLIGDPEELARVLAALR